MANAESVHAKSPYISLRFAEASDVVNISNTGAKGGLHLENVGTFEVWIYPEKETSLGYILFKKACFAVALQDGELVVAFGNDHPGWKWIHSNWRALLCQWTHISVTYDADKESTCVYVNGALVNTSHVKGHLGNNDNHLQIGVKSFKKMGTKRTRFVGRLADVRLWNVARSSEQIASNWGELLTGREEGFVGYWRLDESIGTTIKDLSDYQNNGDIEGATWHMTVHVPPTSLVEDMKRMLNCEVGSDIKLFARDKTSFMYAHKIILVTRCEVFRAMLTCGMKEATQSEIVLPELEFPLLSLLLEFIYTDTVELTGEHVIELLIAADKYRLERLKKLCENFILYSISFDNVCNIFETADHLQEKQLRGVCFRWIVNNFGEVLKSDSYTELDRRLQAEVNKAAAEVHFSKKRSRDVVMTLGSPSATYTHPRSKG